MSEMKHTSGPWIAEYDDFGDEIFFGGYGCGTWKIGPGIYLGGDGLTDDGRKAMEADAKLIAAAPDLLEALKALYLHLVANDDEGIIEHSEQMRKEQDAITKAEGRS